MDEMRNVAMTPEEELVEVLLDFIIVGASLAKKVSLAMREKENKEGENVNGQIQRTGHGNQRPANRCIRY